MDGAAANYSSLKSRLRKESIDFSHIRLGSAHNLGKKLKQRSMPLEEAFQKIFVYDSITCRAVVRRYLQRYKLIAYQCGICGLEPRWNQQPLVFVLDHIDGRGNNHLLENLRWLCPNCNSQTPTFSGRNIKYKRLPKPKPTKEERVISIRKTACRRRKVERPTKDELEVQLRQLPILQIARKYGVTDNAIRKWSIYYDIPYKTVSIFSRVNRKKQIKIKKIYSSQYLYVSYLSSRRNWASCIKSHPSKKLILYKRFDTELEAAQAVASFFHSDKLILRNYENIKHFHVSDTVSPPSINLVPTTLNGKGTGENPVEAAIFP
jgi:hypothetical protein